MFAEERQKSVGGSFSFVALDDLHQPTGIFSEIDNDNTKSSNELEWR